MSESVSTSPPPAAPADLYYWMRLSRTFDERMMALWKQGRGVGGTFSGRGHEAIAVGATACLRLDDVLAPMHRDLGAYFLKGITPRRIAANMLGRETGVTRGRDANLHGVGDMSVNLFGFISHLPHALPAALGAAMAFRYRSEPRVALTFTGDGASGAGLFHETLNMASVFHAPLIVVVENNKYAYSTPLEQSMKVPQVAPRAAAYDIPGVEVDGNDVQAVKAVVGDAVARARAGGGPTLIEAHTMRLLGHAVHDGAEYVPPALLAEWNAREPVRRERERLLASGVPESELMAMDARCEAEVEDAWDFAFASPWPDPAGIAEGVYA